MGDTLKPECRVLKAEGVADRERGYNESVLTVERLDGWGLFASKPIACGAHTTYYYDPDPTEPAPAVVSAEGSGTTLALGVRSQ